MDEFYGARTSEEFVPHLNWTEDSMGHYLSVHLPGFKEEEVMVSLAYPGYVTISGERIVNDHKSIYFAQALQLPENLDMNRIGQVFEGEMLSLYFPKRVEESNEIVYSTAKETEQEEPSNDENERKHDERHRQSENGTKSNQTDDHVVNVQKEMRKQTDDHVVSAPKEMRKEGSILERVIDLLKNNITFTVVLAFSLGAFVSRMFESNG